MTALHIAAAGEPGAAESRSASLGDIRVHYTSYGEGPFAVVFVHGWTCDETVWEGQGPALVAQNVRAITIDLPGHGQSDKPHIDYTPDLSARAIAAVLDHAGVKTTVLVGHSLGTAAIRQAYRHFPERIVALVVVDGALRPFGDAAMLEKFIAPLRGPGYEKEMARSIEGMTRQIQDVKARERIKASMGRSPQHVTVSAMEATGDPALWKPDMIGAPVLMVMARSPRWNADYEQFVRSFIPNLDYQTWENVSHFLMMEKPREFTDALLAFMRKHLLLHERS
jgi:pimeloyl-ACP methyl ester carboxylesterase